MPKLEIKHKFSVSQFSFLGKIGHGEQLPNFEEIKIKFLPCKNKKPSRYIFCLFGGNPYRA
jgi:hypothetical protein